jgi:uncharacterized membrane protein YbhN (UPF0104 family)
MHSTRDSAAEPPAGQPASVGGLLTGRRIMAGVVLAIVVLTALVLFGDARDLATAFRRFEWRLLPLVLLLTLWNYAWRFVKWELYLRRLNVPPLRFRSSLLVFLSAFSMSLTPGKVGELVKSVYLRRLTGEPVSRTSAIVAAERVTDALAMLILAAAGLVQFSYGRPFLAALAVVIALGLLAMQRQALLLRALGVVEGWPVVGGPIRHAYVFLEASGVLYRPGTLASAVGLGVVSWIGECVAFLLVLHGLGLAATWHLLIVATFVLAVSSLAGGASLLPGGLGVADASVAGMLLLLVADDGMNRTVAAGATLLIRFATLWFAVLLGVAAVALLERGMAGRTGFSSGARPGGAEGERPTAEIS